MESISFGLITLGVFGLFALVALLSSFYTVEQQEEAVTSTSTRPWSTRPSRTTGAAP